VARHQVGHGHGHGARDARQAVHQHAGPRRHGRVYKLNGLWEPGAEVLAPVVGDGDLQVVEALHVHEGVGHVGRDVEDVGDAVVPQLIEVGRVLGAAEVEVGHDVHGVGAGDGGGHGARGQRGRVAAAAHRRRALQRRRLRDAEVAQPEEGVVVVVHGLAVLGEALLEGGEAA